jgi:carboxylesterase
LRRANFNAILAASLIVTVASSCTRAPDEPDAKTFADARRAIEHDIAMDAGDDTLSLEGRTRFYHYGRPVSHAILLLHGFTNCPQQFDEFARDLYARGCNVYVPRIPHHGKKYRLTQDLQDLNVAEMRAFAERTFKLSRLLGTRTTVLGLSLGATLAMWLAQTQPADLVIPIAPFLMPAGWNRTAGGATMRAAMLLPNFYWWWDIRLLTGTRPLYAYPGYPIHALAQITFLGDSIFDLAAKAKPLARRCVLVLNADDNGISNSVAADLLAIWQHQRAPYTEVILRDLGKPRHDIIDPTTFPDARTLVYPRLAALALS